MKSVLSISFSCCFFLHTIISAVRGESIDIELQREFYIINLDGKNLEEFEAVKGGLQVLLAKLASNFCNATGLSHSSPITALGVNINDIVKCPSEWPLSDHCVSVNFSIPIDSAGKYELSAKNLQNVWQKHTTLELSQLGVQEYEMPSNSTILVLWMCITGTLFLLFIIILIIVVKTKFIENYIRRRRDVMGMSNKEWLAQNSQKQLVPPFFYPEPSDAKDIEDHTLCNIKQDGFGIENPGYMRDNPMTQVHNIDDDFDSEDDTIYPPSPLPPPPPPRVRDLPSRKTTKEEETVC